MTDQIVKRGDMAIELQADVEVAERLKKHRPARNTKLAYENDWRQFSEWCEERKLQSFPTDSSTLLLWLAHLRRHEKRPSTIFRKLSAMSSAHRKTGLPSPVDHFEIREAMRNIKLEMGEAEDQAKPMLIEDIHACLKEPNEGDSLHVVRDRSILLFAWIGALRRSEVANSEMKHLSTLDDGFELTVPRSKTDQTGRGRLVEIFPSENPKVCPALALRTWLERSGVVDGFVFRQLTRRDSKQPVRVLPDRLHPESIREIIRRLAGPGFTAHSTRAGFATQAYLDGRSEFEIMRQTGHKSVTVLRKYGRFADARQHNAAKGLLK